LKSPDVISATPERAEDPNALVGQFCRDGAIRQDPVWRRRLLACRPSGRRSTRWPGGEGEGAEEKAEVAQGDVAVAPPSSRLNMIRAS
jgi:hypothetical protein